jgi:hypothetical protein
MSRSRTSRTIVEMAGRLLGCSDVSGRRRRFVRFCGRSDANAGERQTTLFVIFDFDLRSDEITR